MTMTNALAMPTGRNTTLSLIDGGKADAEPLTWWERRASMRQIVGGCPDHWWKPTARRTAACTCDRF